MTSQHSHTTRHGPHASDLSSTAAVGPDAIGPVSSSIEAQAESFGQRLRHAREARGQELAACAHILKLPVRVLHQLERDERNEHDHQVYLASYISSYGRHLGIDENALQAEIRRIQPIELPLVATGGISHSRYLLDRYATAATYVVLTAVIIVPMIWLGVRGTLDRDISHLAPLDAAPVAQQELHNPAAGKPASSMQIMAAADTALPPPRADAPQADEQPLLASMVPNMSSGSLQPATPAAAADADAQMVGRGSHSVALTLATASWVEVTSDDGSRLEYGLLPAGSHKTYRSNQSLEVRIGNASGAQVAVDAQPVALDNYRRANVAHLRVEIRDGKAAPRGI